MINRKALALCSAFSFLVPAFTIAAGPGDHPDPLPPDHLHLSPALGELLKQEMTAIQQGMQSLVPAITSGNWKAVTDIGVKIQDSYIMQQQLTRPQREELRHALPAAFRELDQSFHHAAGMLAHAAKMKNADIVTFYFYKLTDTCIGCHTKFASHRFPGLLHAGETGEHQH